MNTKEPYGKISVINGLRGFAILGVMYQHLFYIWTPPGFRAMDIFGLKFLPFTLLSNGWNSVTLFFILSGFVLYLPYATGKRSLRNTGDTVSFYKRRARRLLPLYYISVLVAMIYIRFPNDLKTFFYHFFIMATATFNFTIDMWTPKYNWVLWSLGIEIWFSVLFPALIVLSEKIDMKRLFIGIALFSLVVRIIGIEIPALKINVYLNVLKDSVIGRLDDFALGMLLCHFYVKWPEWKPTFRMPLSGSFMVGIILLWMCFTAWDYVVMGLFPMRATPYLHSLFLAGMFFFILPLLYSRNRWVAVIFSNRPIQVMGLMCYSIYVWHGIAILPILKVAFQPAPPARIAVYLLMVLLISALTYRYIEFGHVKNTRRLFLME